MAPPIVLQGCTMCNMVVISCAMYNVQGCAKKRRNGASQPNLQLFQLFLALDKAPRLSFRIERILLSDQSQICPYHMIRIQISLAHHSPSPSERAGRTSGLNLVTCKDLRLNGWLVVERRTRRRGNEWSCRAAPQARGQLAPLAQQASPRPSNPASDASFQFKTAESCARYWKKDIS